MSHAKHVASKFAADQFMRCFRRQSNSFVYVNAKDGTESLKRPSMLFSHVELREPVDEWQTIKSEDGKEYYYNPKRDEERKLNNNSVCNCFLCEYNYFTRC